MKKIIALNTLKDFIEKEVPILTKSDVELHYASSGKALIRMHEEIKADIIITELDFPDMGCEQLCSTVRMDKVLRNVSILIICSNSPSDLERCLQCGVNDYLVYPLVAFEFLRKVLRLLNIAQRTVYRVIVKATTQGQGKQAHFFCTSKNLSTSGMLLETEKTLVKGDTLAFSFFLPKSVRVLAQGEIVRITQTENGTKEYGVKFFGISPSVESKIETFIHTWLKRTKRHR